LKIIEDPILKNNELLKEENVRLRQKLDQSNGTFFYFILASFFKTAKIHELRSEYSELKNKFLEMEQQREQYESSEI